MFGIDVIKENLPALPYLNMLDVQHFHREAHWAAVFLRSTGSRKPSPPRISATSIPNGPTRRLNKRSRPRCPSAASIAPISSPGSCMPKRGFRLASFLAPPAELWRFGPRSTRAESLRVPGASSPPRRRTRERAALFSGVNKTPFSGTRHRVRKPSLIDPIRTYAAKQFKTFVDALRKDCQNPDLPVIFAQNCRHHNGAKTMPPAGKRSANSNG